MVKTATCRYYSTFLKKGEEDWKSLETRWKQDGCRYTSSHLHMVSAASTLDMSTAFRGAVF